MLVMNTSKLLLAVCIFVALPFAQLLSAADTDAKFQKILAVQKENVKILSKLKGDLAIKSAILKSATLTIGVETSNLISCTTDFLANNFLTCNFL